MPDFYVKMHYSLVSSIRYFIESRYVLVCHVQYVLFVCMLYSLYRIKLCEQDDLQMIYLIHVYI